jgi:hypothetical protein
MAPARPAPRAPQPTRQLARVDPTKPPPPVIPVGRDVAPPDPVALGRMALAAIGEGRIDAMDVDTQRRFLIQMARTLGLNPVTNPFLIIAFEGKKTLYLTKGGAEQLAGVHRVSTEVVRRWQEFGMLMTLVRAQQGERFADATGVVPFEDARGELLPLQQRPRAIKICETQARRRAILGLLGLGFLDRPTPTDPDAFEDRHGNLASRPPARALPESTATNEEIWPDDYEEPGVAAAADRGDVVGVTPEDVAAADASADTQAGAVASPATHDAPVPPGARGAPTPPPLTELQENCLALHRRARALHVAVGEPPLEAPEPDLVAYHDSTLAAIDAAAAAQPRGRGA